MELPVGIEPTASSLPRTCSTTEPRQSTTNGRTIQRPLAPSRSDLDRIGPEVERRRQLDRRPEAGGAGVALVARARLLLEPRLLDELLEVLGGDHLERDLPLEDLAQRDLDGAALLLGVLDHGRRTADELDDPLLEEDGESEQPADEP